MNTKKLPPVGSDVMVHDSDGTIVRCVVTESSIGPASITQRGYGDRNRRISARGAVDPTFRVGGIIHRDENVYGASVWYFEYEPSVEGSDPAAETACDAEKEVS
jgi:hypothetical protein